MAFDIASITPILGGLSVAGLIAAFFMPGDEQAALGRRMKDVKDRRNKLRELAKGDVKKANNGRINDDTTKLMRTALEKFQLQELMSDSVLRHTLARAGWRGPRVTTYYLFARLVLPFALGALAVLYFLVLSPAPFNPAKHSAIAFGVTLVGYYLPTILVKNATSKRLKEMGRAYPDALDLMVICVESGMSVERAMQKVSDEIATQSLALSEEFAMTNAELSYLGDRAQAWENFAIRTGMKSVKALTGAVIQAERYGTPIAQALRVLSEESRGERMSFAERKAASLPAKLTVPMIIFFLPVLFVVIIGPTVIQIRNMP